MKIFLLLCSLVAALASPGQALGQERGFSYGDIIMIPRVAVDDQDPDRLPRCDYLIRGENSRLWLGYVLEIPAPYEDGTHRFSLVDGLMGLTIGADFDVTFAPELGTCNAPLASATRFHEPGDEHGVVPAGTRYAIITLRSPETPGATFFLEITSPAPANASDG